MVSERDNHSEANPQVIELVGREGVEPSTKRLRAAIPNADAFRFRQLQLPLSSNNPVSGSISPGLADFPGQLSPDDPVTYRRAEDDLQAAYVGRHGARLIVKTTTPTGHLGLRYVAACDVRPTPTSTPEHP